MTFLNMSAKMNQAHEEIRELRKMLWLRHGCPPYTLYGDDGEMQCNNPSCMIDFNRDSIETIQHRWRSHSEKLLEEDAIIEPSADQQAPMIDKAKDDR